MNTAMATFSRAAEDYPALITRAVLDAYAQYVVAGSNSSDTLRPDGVVGAEAHGVPKSIEEALAPLEILYGKTALSAIGIALHGTEPVIRYVEGAEVDLSDDDESVKASDDDVECVHHEAQRARRSGADAVSSTARSNTVSQKDDQGSAAAVSSQVPVHRARCLYQVGEHTLFSPYYCPCSAYAYQSIQRQEVWCCKHMLALQLALRIEATGVVQDSLSVRIVSPAEYEQLLLRSL
ncbi:conserved hypothetical protein [Leishmania mexicana MHOM/GT/2001/U1103]|uniref:SWIM-type domain-containing protein n=1 Tax=Leishmania mexicana (strain MHOM/GT/2001/U1103) TaxID=929439 RepID=E9ATZ7_LEIMU|nr:conserved hypothetical protein [Leishmania mexicana MHOM/GT/2001/U1103]CBZ26422.1 conserved hypothetical protein [Leishmania mexicana MHOM/GT/2001/U1103]